MNTLFLPAETQTEILLFLARSARLCAPDCRRLDLGLRPDHLDRLCGLRVDEVELFGRLILDSKPLLRVVCDPEHLDLALRRIDAKRTANSMRDEFIRRGAPVAMMMRLFQMGGVDLAQRRKMLEIKAKIGRPKLPDDDTQFKIYKTWKSLKHPNIRQRYLDLHDQFPEIPIAVLYAISVEHQS